MMCTGRYAAYEALMAYPGGLQLGGGVTLDNAIEYLNAGASHVIVTSFVFREGRLEEERLRSLVQTPHQCLTFEKWTHMFQLFPHEDVQALLLRLHWSVCSRQWIQI